jgi:hypothetical protein
MRLELIPVLIGALLILLSAGIIYDAAAPSSIRPFRERRRRQRAEIDRVGEWFVALGIACLGASLIGNEIWRWTTIVNSSDGWNRPLDHRHDPQPGVSPGDASFSRRVTASSGG